MLLSDTVIPANADGRFLLRIYQSRADFKQRAFIEHHHSAFEISYILSGRGLYRIGNREVDIREGDVYLFSTNEVHCITEIHDNKPMILLNVHFEPRFIWSPSDNALDQSFLRIFLDRGEGFSDRLDRDNPTTADISALMLKMQKEAEERLEAFELMIKTYLLHILVLLIRDYNYVSPKASFSARLPTRNRIKFLPSSPRRRVS